MSGAKDSVSSSFPSCGEQGTRKDGSVDILFFSLFFEVPIIAAAEAELLLFY